MTVNARHIALGSLRLRNDGILHAVFDFDGEPTAEAASEYLAARESLVGSRSVPVIIELVKVPYTERSIRMFFMAGMTPPRCRAVVSTDASTLTVFRTFQLADPIATPTEFFTTVDDAAEWIRSLNEGEQDPIP